VTPSRPPVTPCPGEANPLVVVAECWCARPPRDPHVTPPFRELIAMLPWACDPLAPLWRYIIYTLKRGRGSHTSTCEELSRTPHCRDGILPKRARPPEQQTKPPRPATPSLPTQPRPAPPHLPYPTRCSSIVAESRGLAKFPVASGFRQA
jgi:hypothetical protein